MIVLLAACAAEPVPVAAPEKPCHEDLASAPAAEGSLYDLRLDLDTATGARVGLDVDRGHPVLLSMMYASCTDVCPATITELSAIAARLPEERRDDVRILLVSLDPERDTVEALDALRRRHELDDRWTLARAPADQVRELAAALGVRYRARPDGRIDHSTVIALLDGGGVVRARLDGLGQPADALLDAVGRMAPRD